MSNQDSPSTVPQREHYRVRRFELHDARDDFALIYSARGALRIDDAAMRATLGWLKDIEGRIVDHCTLERHLTIFDARSDEALAFLVERAALLAPIPTAYRGADRLAVLTDVPDQLAPVLADLAGEVPIVQLDSPQAVAQVDGQAVVLTFLSSYRAEPVQALYAHGSARHIYLTSYLLERTLFLDVPYCPDQGQPCHFCQMGRLRQVESQLVTNTRSGWFHLKHYVLEENLPLRLAVEPSTLEWGLIGFHLAHETRKFVCHEPQTILQEHMQMQLMVDLDLGRARRDVTMHWEYCDCYAR